MHARQVYPITARHIFLVELRMNSISVGDLCVNGLEWQPVVIFRYRLLDR